MLFTLKKAFSWSITISFCFTTVLLPLTAGQDAGKPADLKGFVYLSEKREMANGAAQVTLTPIENAVVMLRNLADKQEYQSEKTPPDGSYYFRNLPSGNYEPGVIVNNKTYNVKGTIRLDPGEDVVISLYIEPKGPALLPIRRGFFNSPWGIAALAAGTATAGLIIYNVVKKEEPEASPTRR